MSWLLQTPHPSSPKLLATIVDYLKIATKAGAAFAFASSKGIKLLSADPAFKSFIGAHKLCFGIGA